MQEPSLVWTHTDRTTNLKTRAETAQNQLLLVTDEVELKTSWTPLTIGIFLHNFHVVVNMQVDLVFGRLSEVCNGSVSVQDDGPRYL